MKTIELGGFWGYPKRKTDPIFEIPTVENHRIDVLHDFFTFFQFLPLQRRWRQRRNPWEGLGVS